MLTGKMVRIRFRRESPEQPAWVFVGRVQHFSEHWVGVEGIGILIFHRHAVGRAQTEVRGLKIVKDQEEDNRMPPIEVDTEARALMLRAEHITSIRVLPDKFDYHDMRFSIKGRRIDILVDGAPDTSIGEMTED